MNTLEFQPEARRYYEQGYWRDGDLWSEFEARAGEHPERVALRLDDRAVTYAELVRAARGVSARLTGSNVQPGDVVILLGRHSIEAAVAMLGCLHLGVVLAPLPPMFNSSQLSTLIGQTKATAIVTFGGEKEIAKCRAVADQVPALLVVAPALVDAMIAEDAPAARTRRHADELAMVMHSSGTTSAPKGIAHSSNTMRYATEALCKRWELTGDDVYLVVCEFGFVGGLIFGYFPVLLNGATGVLVNKWDAPDALRLVEQHRCTYVLLMPTHAADVLTALEHNEHDLSSLRALAAPGLTSERRLAMKEAFGVNPLADYGLSEVPGHAAHGLNEPQDKMIATEGRPYDGTEIRIVDEHGEPVPADTVGNVVVNGPSRFLGFLHNPELTQQSLDERGGYRTGDLGTLDEDGHFTFVGRSKDIIRRGGVTVLPAELETVLLRHPAIHDIAVVGLPDERLGERACAAIIASEGELVPTLEQLQAFLEAEGVAKYTWPESVEAFTTFPRTPSLKVVKRDVVEQILERRAVPA